MIGIFPSFYPDELVYSLLARYYVRTGYGVYRSVAEELFENNDVFAEIEFVHKLKEDVLALLTKDISMEELILSHTMFPYYGRFITKERRDKALRAILGMEGNYQKLLPINKNKNRMKRYLRWCPECVRVDRSMYGETYWHRIHQMEGVDVCPVHGCWLHDSDVEISRKSNSSLISAEELVFDGGEVCCNESALEVELARYVRDVFQSPMDFQSDVTVGRYLHSRLAYTKYVSPRGQKRRMQLLTEDFANHYKGLPEMDFKEKHMMEGIFKDKRHRMYEICMLGKFLNVSADEFTHMVLPEKKQEQEFDERVRAFHEQGLNYREIAVMLNAPYDVVKPVGEHVYGKYKPKKSRRKQELVVRKKDWTKDDEEMFPVVRATIKQLQGNGIERPRKITVYSVSKALGISREHIRNRFPKCKAEIEKYKETQEKYWAREVVWATKEIEKEGGELSWSRIARMTNTRKPNLIASIPYLNEFADDELVRQIVTVIKGDERWKD